MNILNAFFNLITYPEKGLELIKRKENWYILIILFLWAQTSRFISGLMLGTIPEFLSYGFPAYIGIILLVWILSCSIIHFFARLFGGRGGVLKFFYLWGWSFFPLLFYPLFGFWTYYLTGIKKAIPIGLFLIWLIFFKINVISINYKLKKISAFFVLISPFLILLLFIFFILVIYLLKTVIGI